MKKTGAGKSKPAIEKGMLAAAALLIVICGIRMGRMNPGDKEKFSPPHNAGYVLVRESSVEYIVELEKESVSVRSLFPAAARDFQVAPCDALEIVRTENNGLSVSLIPQGMDNRTRYVLEEKMELNRATALDLSLVKGLGRVRAERIVSARDNQGGFKDWREIEALPETSDGILANLREMFFIGNTLPAEMK